jgi:hypothetical protein
VSQIDTEASPKFCPLDNKEVSNCKLGTILRPKQEEIGRINKNQDQNSVHEYETGCKRSLNGGRETKNSLDLLMLFGS